MIIDIRAFPALCSYSLARQDFTEYYFRKGIFQVKNFEGLNGETPTCCTSRYQKIPKSSTSALEVKVIMPVLLHIRVWAMDQIK